MATSQTVIDTDQNRYLSFSATSMKALVNAMLQQSGTFSDQLFEGSNLSILNNLFAFTFDTTMFYLNHAAAESMFTDVQYYEDANRIVKILNYSPRGFITSMAALDVSIKQADSTSTKSYLFPRYLTFKANNLTYSLVEDFDVLALNGVTIADNKKLVMHNGIWQAYPDLIIANGIPFETFTLPALNLNNTQNPLYVAHPFIDIYVEESVKNQNSGVTTKVVNRWTRVVDLYDSGTNDYVYEIRLNEKKQYEIKFGDNISGRRLPQQAILHIVFLKSDGPSGVIGAGAIDTTIASPTTTILAPTVNGLNADFVWNVLLQGSANSYATTSTLQNVFGFKNTEASTSVVDFEGVDEMKAYAPNTFRMQNRLVTAQDFEQYVLSNHFGNNEIHDAKAQSNADYMREFQQWLYSYGKLSPEILYYGYQYSDACDFNNIYLWLKSSHASGAPVSFNSKTLVTTGAQKLKSLTSELVVLDPIMVAFTPYYPNTVHPTWTDIVNPTFGTDHNIVITRDKNSMVAVETIRKKVLNSILDFFNVSNNSLGGKVDVGVLLATLLSISGVKNVQTVKLGTPSSPQLTFNGLSFGVWTPLIVRGLDYKYVNGTVSMSTFQFPFLYDDKRLLDKIQVQSENFKLNNIEF